MQNYLMNINFGNFIGSRIISLDANDDGRKIDGIFIPFKYNAISPWNGKVFGRFNVFEMEGCPESGYTHKIRPYLTKDERNELVNELGYKIPFLGHLRPLPSYFNFKKNGNTNYEKPQQFVKRKKETTEE